MMAWPTIICGAILIIDGLVGYFQQSSDHPSLTALIPCWFGIPLFLCGVLAFKDKLRKHVMHLAVLIGFIGAVGVLARILTVMNKPGGFDPSKPAAIAQLVMLAVCVVFVVMCVKSFVDVRKARKAGGLAAPQTPLQ